jgi:TolA-binding protein
MKEFTEQFEARGAEQLAVRPKDLERKLRAAEARVTNVTRLMTEMPDDLDIRRQREADQAEVRRLTAEIAARATAGAVPSKKAIATAAPQLLAAVADAAPERARDALARAMAPLILTPKRVGPDHLVEVIGSLDLTVPAVGAVVRSGGRI